MKPFDLENALDGDPVVTRDGKWRAAEIVCFKSTEINFPVKAILVNDAGGTVEQCFTRDGNYWSTDGEESEWDLFMGPLKKYAKLRVRGTEILGGVIYDTEEEALANMDRNSHFTLTVGIEI